MKIFIFDIVEDVYIFCCYEVDSDIFMFEFVWMIDVVDVVFMIVGKVVVDD